MLQQFRKPTSEIALMITFYGAFNPLIFDKYWFAKNKLIGEVEAENLTVNFLSQNGVSLEFDYCDFKADDEKIMFKIDQINFLKQTMDLMSGVLFNLKTIPIEGAKFRLYPHFDLHKKAEVDKFFNSVSPNSFWDKVVLNSELNEIVVKQKRKDKYAYELIINIARCPKSENLIHLFLDDTFYYKEDNLNANDVKEFIDEALEKSFNHSIDLINKLTNAI